MKKFEISLFVIAIFMFFLVGTVSAITVTSNGNYTSYIDGSINYSVYTFLGNATFNVSGGTLNTSVLVVAGGGGGGVVYQYHAQSGGGAGGLVYNNEFLMAATNYDIKVGKGGWGGIARSRNSTVGQNSSITNSTGNIILAFGGGTPDSWWNTMFTGMNGGSGAGQLYTGTQYQGLPPQGRAGGTGNSNGGGGGGGYGTMGGNGTAGLGGQGGNGSAFDINGTSIYYAGGGGGAVRTGTGGIGGLGGGGDGRSGTVAGGAGVNGTGGGGGAGGNAVSSEGTGGDGGSGIIIIRYNTADLDPAASATNPSVVLDAPAHNANYTITSGTTYPLILNTTVTDLNPAGIITNVSLYINGVLNETNSTACVNCTYSFTKYMASAKYNWSVLAYNNNSKANDTISILKTFWIKDGVSTCNVFFNTTSPITFPDYFIAYTDCNTDYTFYYNGTSILNETTINAGVGAYNLSVIRDAGDELYSNYYDEEEFRITADTSVCGVYFNTTSPITYPELFIPYTNCSSAYTFYIDGSEITNNSVINAGAGTYNISVQRTDTQNYSSTFNDESFTVDTLEDGCGIYFNTTSPVEYPNTFTVWTNCSAGTLRRNDTEILNNSQQSLLFGTYNFSFQRTDTQNYTTNYDDEWFEVTDTQIPSITLRTPLNTTYYISNNITINFSVSDNNFANATYNINGTNMTTTSNETQDYITLKDGIYTLYIWAVDGGWATDYDTRTFTVRNVNLTYPANNYILTSAAYPLTVDLNVKSISTNYTLTNLTIYSNASGTWAPSGVQLNSSNTVTNTTASATFYTNLTDISRSSSAAVVYYLPEGSGKPVEQVAIDCSQTAVIGVTATITYYNGATTAYTDVCYDPDPGVAVNLIVPVYNQPITAITVQRANTTSTLDIDGVTATGWEVYATQENNTRLTITSPYTIWNALSCNSPTQSVEGMICDWGEANRSIYSNIAVNSIYSSSPYETTTTSYWINVSANSSLTAATLFLDGAPYTPTESGDIWNYTRVSPADFSGNKSLIWQLTYAGNTYNTTTQYQTINPIALIVCQAGARVLNTTAGFTTKYLDVFFRNETDAIEYTSAEMDLATINYWIEGTTYKTLTYTNNTANTNYSFCFYPNTSSLQTNMTLKYSGTIYPQRTAYFLENLTSAGENKTLFMTPSSTGIYSIYQVQDAYQNLLSDVSVVVERQLNSVWTTIETGTTDSAGSVTFWLNPDYLHRFTFTKTGYPLTIVTIKPSSSTYTVTMGSMISYTNVTYQDYMLGITWNATPKAQVLTPNTIYTFTFGINATYSNLTKYKMELIDNNSNILATVEGTNPAGSILSYDLNVTTYGAILGRYSIDKGQGYWVIDADYYWWVDVQDIPERGTLKSFFKYISAPEPGSDAERRSYTRTVLFFIILFMVLGLITYTTGFDISTSGGAMILLLPIVWFASAGGFFAMNYEFMGSNSLASFNFLEKYTVAIIVTLLTGGLTFWQLAKERG